MITAIAFITFLGIVGWAYSPARKSRFEQDARLPFDETEDGESR